VRIGSRSTAARLLGVGLFVLLTAGCQAHLSLVITVDADGAGQLAISVRADADLLANAEAAGADPLGDLAATGALLEAEGWRSTDVLADDGARTVTLAAPFDGPEEFNAIAAELTGALGAPELAPLEGLRMDLGEDEIRVSGVAALQPGPAVTELGLQPEQAVTVLQRHRCGASTTSRWPYRGRCARDDRPRVTDDAGPLRWRVRAGGASGDPRGRGPTRHPVVVPRPLRRTRRRWRPSCYSSFVRTPPGGSSPGRRANGRWSAPVPETSA
jgi:hypothetical protein